jgi:cytochrome c-type biogenesis protein CcmH
MRKLLLGLWIVTGWPAVLPAAETATPPPVVSEDPRERAMLEIAKELRCAVCQNQPVSESNSDLARDMRAIISEQLAAGRTRNEIVQYFVDRYGDYVLITPPTDRTGFLLWLAPPLVLIVLALAAGLYLRRRVVRATPPAPALSAEDAERVRKAREENKS